MHEHDKTVGQSDKRFVGSVIGLVVWSVARFITRTLVRKLLGGKKSETTKDVISRI